MKLITNMRKNSYYFGKVWKNKMRFNIYKKFFRNKKIFITGNTGFVGSYLSIILSLFGAKVLGYALKKKDKGYLSNQNQYMKKIKTIHNDLSQINRYKNRLKRFKPEIVIHLASQAIVKESYLNTKKNYKTNILGTVELFELLKKIPTVNHVLIFTSDKVYLNVHGKYLNENSQLGGLDPYSSSKSSQDIISNSYKESFFKKDMNITIIRAGNIIGGGDFDYSRIVPDLFFSIKNNKKLILRNPLAVRPWQHIFDVVNAIMLSIYKNYKKIQPKAIIFNVGPDNKSNISVIKLVLKIKNKFICIFRTHFIDYAALSLVLYFI